MKKPLKKSPKSLPKLETGNIVQVQTKASEYLGLRGEVSEVIDRESCLVAFSEEELNRAKRPDRVLCYKRPVHFYNRELKRIA